MLVMLQRNYIKNISYIYIILEFEFSQFDLDDFSIYSIIPIVEY